MAKPGPSAANDVTMTPLDAALKLTRLDLTGSGIVGPSSGLAGSHLARRQGSLGWTKRAVAGKRQGRAIEAGAKWVTAAKPVAMFDFSLAHDLNLRTGALRRGDIQIGSARASLAGTDSIRGDCDPDQPDFRWPEYADDRIWLGMLPALGITLPSGASLQGRSDRRQDYRSKVPRTGWSGRACSR